MSEMGPPIRIKVGSAVYGLEITDLSNQKYGDTELYGRSSHTVGKETVILHSGMRGEQMVACFLHELFHAIIAQSVGVQETRSKEGRLISEEGAVGDLATGLTLAWARNPGLLPWLSSLLQEGQP